MRGVVWLLLSLGTSAVWCVTSKLATDRIGVAWTFVLTNLLQVPVIIWLVARNRPPGDWVGVLWGLATGVLGICGYFAILHAYQHFSGSVVTAVVSLHVVLAVLMFLLLGERLTLRQWLGVALGLVAALLLTLDSQGTRGGVDGRADNHEVVRERIR